MPDDESQGFLPPFLAGLLVPVAVGAAVFVAVVVAGMFAHADDALGRAVNIFYGAATLAIGGMALIGAGAGLAAGTRTRSRGLAAGAGAAAAAAGMILVVLLAYTGTELGAAIAPDDTGSGDGFFDFSFTFFNGPEWSDLGWDVLLTVPAAAAAGALAGLFVAGGTVAPGHAPATPDAAPASVPRGAAPHDRKLQCPKCHNVIHVPAGTKPRCTSCGFGG